ncbi:MAG TPA: D-alanyl-D-alanine carboxypeptidase [Candidatus Onthoplasma faecipullorum]|nr:D-alanyl-D-alanine carboxypeptidase [Candidatus Onthoplasma faecipullorum]
MSNVKKFKFTLVLISLIVLCVGVFVPIVSQSMPAYASSSAKGMCVIEKDTGRVLYSKNMNEKLPMASTTKIMTLITVLQNCDDLDQYIQVDDLAVGVEGTSIYLRKNETIKVRDLLYGLMLRSGNDAATALACHVGGSVKGFCKLMNELATKIGAKNSHFNNPHGLDDPEHYTTAYDLALITAYALNNTIFKEVVSTKNHVIPETNMSDIRYLTNKNKLLSRLDGCVGVKTGFTSKAGRCLVSACERDNMTTVCVVLNCGPMFEESESLLNASFNEYNHTLLVDKNKEIPNKVIENTEGERLYIYPENDFYYPLKENEKDKVEVKYNIEKSTAEDGEVVGNIEIFYDNQLIKTLKLYTMNKIDKLIENNTLQLNEF